MTMPGFFRSHKCHKDKTGVVNDPLGQTHTQQAVMICFVSLDYEKWGRTDVRTPRVNIVTTTGHVQVGLGDQQDRSRQ